MRQANICWIRVYQPKLPKPPLSAEASCEKNKIISLINGVIKHLPKEALLGYASASWNTYPEVTKKLRMLPDLALTTMYLCNRSFILILLVQEKCRAKSIPML
jgi:hypothetical protein